MDTTFAELFCRQHRLPPQRFNQAMLRCCLYPRARFIQPLLAIIWPGHFKADYELISRVGRLTELGALDHEIGEFHDHPANRGFLRRTLRLRISTKRLRRNFCSLMRRPASPTADPATGVNRVPAS
jgi:hypothetical protein